MAWRWREDSRPGDPETNMAVDTDLLEELARDAVALPIVRVYRWDRPSVSFGRLQEENAVRGTFPGLPLVRRPTGGRAVLHGNDVCVTVICRESELPTAQGRGVLSSYRQIVSGIVSAFEALNVPARLGGEAKPNRALVDCFAVTASCDVVNTVTEQKLAGCAQRRLNGVILQQMSIPLENLPDASKIAGAIKAGMRDALGVGEWVVVDTMSPV